MTMATAAPHSHGTATKHYCQQHTRPQTRNGAQASNDYRRQFIIRQNATRIVFNYNETVNSLMPCRHGGRQADRQ